MNQFYIIFLGIFINSVHGQKDCEIVVNKKSYASPFYLTHKSKILRPKFSIKSDIGKIMVKPQEKIRVDCLSLGGTNKILTMNTSYLNVECEKGFFFNGLSTVNLTFVECNDIVFPEFIKIQMRCSPIGSDGRMDNLESLFLVYVGFNLPDRFYLLYTVCIDEKRLGSIWAYNFLKPKEEIYSVYPTTRKFRTNPPGSFLFFKNVTRNRVLKLYSRENQISSMKTTLQTNNSIYFNGSNVQIIKQLNEFFSKGHLVTSNSFPSVAEQRGTYFFINIVPQWGHLNAGNWVKMERILRKMAIRHAKELDVYTGTFGILRYPDKFSVPQDIYLEQDQKYFPIPLLLWKVIYYSKNHSSLAFIALNDPYSTISLDFYCKSICEQTNFYILSQSNHKKGHIHCCRAEDLRSKIKSIPDLSKMGIQPSLLFFDTK